MLLEQVNARSSPVWIERVTCRKALMVLVRPCHTRAVVRRGATHTGENETFSTAFRYPRDDLLVLDVVLVVCLNVGGETVERALQGVF